MSTILVCPECDKKLRVPDTVMDKAFRCPACKALIPSASESNSPEPSRSVKPSPSPRSAVAPSRRRPLQEEEPEDDFEPEQEQAVRDKPRRKRSKRNNSSTGLIIGLLGGGAVLLLLVLGGGGWLLWHVSRNKGIPDAEWQTFTPPGGDCIVLMPGTPVPQTRNSNGIQLNQYIVERQHGHEAFGIVIYDVPPHVLRPSLMEDIANTYRKGVMDILGGGKGTSDRPITLGNIAGLEFQGKLTEKRGGLIGRIYVAKVGNKQRGYLLAVVNEFMQPNTADAARFFDSFKITASATAADLSGAAALGGGNPPGFVNPPPANPPGFVNPPPANQQPNPPPGFRRPRLPRQP